MYLNKRTSRVSGHKFDSRSGELTRPPMSTIELGTGHVSSGPRGKHKPCYTTSTYIHVCDCSVFWIVVDSIRLTTLRELNSLASLGDVRRVYLFFYSNTQGLTPWVLALVPEGLNLVFLIRVVWSPYGIYTYACS